MYLNSANADPGSAGARYFFERRREKEEGRREKGEGRREKGEGGREKGEGRRGKGEGGREKGEGRRGKGEGRRGKREGDFCLNFLGLLLLVSGLCYITDFQGLFFSLLPSS